MSVRRACKAFPEIVKLLIHSVFFEKLLAQRTLHEVVKGILPRAVKLGVFLCKVKPQNIRRHNVDAVYKGCSSVYLGVYDFGVNLKGVGVNAPHKLTVLYKIAAYVFFDCARSLKALCRKLFLVYCGKEIRSADKRKPYKVILHSVTAWRLDGISRAKFTRSLDKLFILKLKEDPTDWRLVAGKEIAYFLACGASIGKSLPKEDKTDNDCARAVKLVAAFAVLGGGKESWEGVIAVAVKSDSVYKAGGKCAGTVKVSVEGELSDKRAHISAPHGVSTAKARQRLIAVAVKRIFLVADEQIALHIVKACVYDSRKFFGKLVSVKIQRMFHIFSFQQFSACLIKASCSDLLKFTKYAFQPQTRTWRVAYFCGSF